MNRIYLNKMTRDFNLELCKVNKKVLCGIPIKSLNSINRSISDIDTIEISIDKYIYNSQMKKVLNPLWNDMKDERLICLNSNEYFVIKENKFQSLDNKKNITAYSLEYKLGKIDISFEDLAFSLRSGDNESIYNLNDFMYEETGWKFGHIDETVEYDITEDDKVERVRLFSSIESRWYNFLMENISQAFNCVIQFDTLKKVINLYDMNSVAENIQIYLSHDNYINSIERISSTNDIVTRLKLIGSEEVDIVSSVPTGYPYIENYDYFMENGEMSDDLIRSIKKYNEMVEIRHVIWKQLVEEKNKKNEENIINKKDLYVIYEEIRALKTMKETYAANGDTVNEALVMVEIAEKQDQQVLLEIEIGRLENELLLIEEDILNINLLCKRETATDENGNLIFNVETLEELKEFVYCDTYSNDSFLNVDDLIKAGERELSLLCYPTLDYTLDIKNFMSRIMKKSFRKQWKGDIGLGDVVILYDEDLDKEIFLYVTDYSQKPNENEDNSLEITLSNKKFKDKNVRVIADKLKEGSLAMRTLQKKSYVLNNIKYNRINITKDQIGGNI